jgi:hypothetical protein
MESSIRSGDTFDIHDQSRGHHSDAGAADACSRSLFLYDDDDATGGRGVLRRSG